MNKAVLANLLDAAYEVSVGPRILKLHWPTLLIDAARVVVATEGVDLPEAKEERVKLVGILREYVKIANHAGYTKIANYIDAAIKGLVEGRL